MKKMFFKALSLMLAIILSLSVFAGCTSSADGNEGETEKEADGMTATIGTTDKTDPTDITASTDTTNTTDPTDTTNSSDPTDATDPVATTPADPDAPAHVHKYETVTVEPTADVRGYTAKVCSCGKKESVTYTGLANADDNPLVLFIGNSYTQYNSLHTLVKSIVEGQGMQISTYAITKGAQTLLDYTDPEDADGKKIDAYISANDPDFIFLQEQSRRPASDPALFYDGVRKMAVKLSSEKQAKIVLYQTWSRKDGHSVLAQYGWTYQEMTYRLAASYEAIAAEMGYSLSPAGSAFLDVYVNHPSIELYDSDKTHPSPTGSYLVALCHYATLYGLSPIGVKYTMGLPAETVAVLQAAAHKAVFGGSIVPKEFRTSSEGVVPTPVEKVNGNLSAPPSSSIISIGITGDNGQVSSKATAGDSGTLTAEQKADLADISYGVSIIGARNMIREASVACDGIWSSGKRLSFYFDGGDYAIDGSQAQDEKYSALITYNFGRIVTMDAIGYLSGNMNGFGRAQDIYVSNDGIVWTKVESACFDVDSLADGESYTNLGKILPDKNGNTTSAFALFDMGGVQGKYVRVGIVTGITTAELDMNTLELVVYGTK